MVIATDLIRIIFPRRDCWQLGDLGVLRGVILGFSEEARTRGFPSPSFGGFGFIVVTTKRSRRSVECINRFVTETILSDGLSAAP
ncbi:protein of unknown function [uncultured Woeseiaceae bacterium]|uniref:Uncharacterized protein n=1 Tax=uncultured Woeseiaceae bacterium TaxID=1983305 RepID=A0A7D9H512_9GAMM|nr:protein of unknown function [uncultured Woeseiaceae bacterium]